MKKRALAFLLCAVMLFSLCPSVTLTALADDEAEEQETVILDDGENELLEEEDPTAETGDDTDLWEDLTTGEEPDAKEEPVADEDHAGEESAAEEEPYDPTETLDEMEADLPYELPDNRHEALAAVAASQLGYEQDATGYTRYADWCARWAADYSTYGEENYHSWDGFDAYQESWDAAFVTFCLYYAGVPADELQAWPEAKLWAEKTELAAEDYDAIVGDLIFLDLSDEDNPVQLNADGEPVLDENGEEVLEPTVDTVGILSRTGDDIWAIVKAEEIKVDAGDILGIAALPEKPADGKEPEAIDPELAELDVGGTRSLLAAGSESSPSVKSTASTPVAISSAEQLEEYLSISWTRTRATDDNIAGFQDSTNYGGVYIKCWALGTSSANATTTATVTNISGASIQIDYTYAAFSNGTSAVYTINGAATTQTIKTSKPSDGYSNRKPGTAIVLEPNQSFELKTTTGKIKAYLNLYEITITVLAPATSTVTFDTPTNGTYTISGSSGGPYIMGNMYSDLDPDTEFTLTPYPNTDYAFDHWIVGEESITLTDNKITASELNGKTLSAVFRSTNATVNFANTAGGTYTVTGTGITTQTLANSASATGIVTANENETVTLTATPDSTHSFAGWYNGETQLSGESPYDIRLGDYNNGTITAHWDSTDVSTTFVPPASGGSYTIGGTAITSSHMITDDYRVEYAWVATPATDYHFVGWYDQDLGTYLSDQPSVTRTLQATRDHTVTAVFAYDYVTQTFPAVPGGSYTITPPAGSTVTAQTVSTTDVNFTGRYDETYTLTVDTVNDLEEWYRFDGWVNASGTVISTDNPCSITLDAAATVKPKFTFYGMTVDFDPAVGGTYTVAADGSALKTVTSEVWTLLGDSSKQYTLTATAGTNYGFYCWKDVTAGTTLSTANPYTDTLPDGHAITAVFRRTDTATFKVGSNTYRYLDEAISALSSSNKYIYVIGSGVAAGSNGQTSFTIPSGYTLVVPYDSSNADHTTAPAQIKGNVTAMSAYVTLTVPSGVTINIESKGSMNVDGQQLASNTSGGNAGYHGTVTGPCGQVKLEEGATINVTGNMYCYGYIYGDGHVVAKSGSTTYELLQIGDWGGGSNATSWNGGSYSSFYFSQYYAQNIESYFDIYSGANTYVYAGITATLFSQSIYGAKAQFIGKSSGLFQITSGYLSRKYDPVADRIIYNIYGTVNTGSISVSLNGVSLNSANYVLGLAENITMNVKSGASATIKGNYMMLPDSKIHVEKGGSLTVNSSYKLYLWDVTDWKAKNHYYNGNTGVRELYSPSRTGTRTLAAGSAQLVVDGTLTMSNNVYVTNNGGTSVDKRITGTGKIVNNSGTAATSLTNVMYFGLDKYTLPLTVAVGKMYGSSNNYDVFGTGTYYSYTDTSEAQSWYKTAAITYDANGGSGTAPLGSSVAPGGSFTTADSTAFSAPSDNTFNGWNTKADGTGTSYSAEQSVTVTQAMGPAITLYAQWTPVTYDVTLNTNGGSYSSDYTAPTSYTYGTAVALPTGSNITKTGYTFGGWYDNGGLTGTAVANITATDTGNKTYFAKWTANTATVTVSYSLTTGNTTATSSGSFTYTYGTKLSDPVYTYYTFQNWTYNGTTYSTSALKTALNSALASGSGQTINVTANFTRQTYTVKLYSYIPGVDTLPGFLEYTSPTRYIGRTTQLTAPSTITDSGQTYYFQYWMIGSNKDYSTGYTQQTSLKAALFPESSGEYYAIAYYGTTEATNLNDGISFRIVNESADKVGDTWRAVVTIEMIGPAGEYRLSDVGIKYQKAAADSTSVGSIESSRSCSDMITAVNQNSSIGGTFTMRFTMDSTSYKLFTYAFATYTPTGGAAASKYYADNKVTPAASAYDTISYFDD